MSIQQSSDRAYQKMVEGAYRTTRRVLLNYAIKHGAQVDFSEFIFLDDSNAPLQGLGLGINVREIIPRSEPDIPMPDFDLWVVNLAKWTDRYALPAVFATARAAAKGMDKLETIAARHR